jgi:hypothetical protein
MSDSVTTTTTIQIPAKSLFIALLLTFFFGPLGLFYASVTGGLVMLGAYLVIALLSVVSFGLGAALFFPAWIATMIWAAMACKGNTALVTTQTRTESASSQAAQPPSGS